MLRDPFVAQLDEFVILNNMEDHWYSKASGEGGVDLITQKQMKEKQGKERRRSDRT